MKIIAYFLIVGSLLLTSCQDSDNSNPSKATSGKLSLELTDAPIDNPNVKSCIVTVANVYVDGIKLEGFPKTTIDLLALQNGKTSSLGEFEIENKSYSSLSLEIDFEKTAQGETPGAYIELQDGTRDAILLSEKTLSLSSAFDIEEDVTKKLVIDVDLRKAIIDEASDTEDADYNLSSKLELNAGLRLVDSETTGIIKGKSTVGKTESQSTIVYIYKMGEFDQNTELNAQGASKLFFSNAISSTSCDSDGNYELHFLPEGEYELYAAKHEVNSKNKMEFSGLFSMDGMLNLDSPKIVTVEAGSTVIVDMSLEGLLGL